MCLTHCPKWCPASTRRAGWMRAWGSWICKENLLLVSHSYQHLKDDLSCRPVRLQPVSIILFSRVQPRLLRSKWAEPSCMLEQLLVHLLRSWQVRMENKRLPSCKVKMSSPRQQWKAIVELFHSLFHRQHRLQHATELHSQALVRTRTLQANTTAPHQTQAQLHEPLVLKHNQEATTATIHVTKTQRSYPSTSPVALCHSIKWTNRNSKHTRTWWTTNDSSTSHTQSKRKQAARKRSTWTSYGRCQRIMLTSIVIRRYLIRRAPWLACMIGRDWRRRTCSTGRYGSLRYRKNARYMAV